MRLEKQTRPDDTGGTDYVGRRRENGGSSDHNPIYGRIKMLFKRHQYPGLFGLMQKRLHRQRESHLTDGDMTG